MKKILLLGAVCCASIMISNSVQAATYTVAANNWSPFSDKTHPRNGVAVEIIGAALNTQGSDIKYSEMPWNRAVDKVKKGQVDIIPTMWHNEERAKIFHFSNYILNNQIKFIKKKGDAFEYNGLSSLKGKTVGTISGFAYSEEFLSDTRVVRVPVKDLETNYKKLMAGRIDLTLDDEIVARSMLYEQDPDFLSKIDFVSNPVSTNELFMTCSKANPKCTTIIKTFNKGLAKIKANGTYKKIMASYGMK